MGTENERKFLVREMPGNLDDFDRMSLVQGYIHTSKTGSELRIRQRIWNGLETTFIAIKSEGDLTRDEAEIEIPPQVYASLFPFTKDRRILKTRYLIPYKNYKRSIELDIYAGNLEGLATAEMEFTSVEEAKSFIPPEWFGKEVTEDKRYKNKNLAVNGKPD